MWRRFFSRQARKPSGLFGRFIAARIFDKGNQPINAAMIGLVEACPGQAILEIGFGCGDVLRELAGSVGDGFVEGIDFSDAMFSVASKRNRRHMADGRVRLTHGNFDTAAYSAGTFDTICSANTIYFWPDQPGTCARIHTALKPGGKVVLGFVGKRKMETMSLDMEVFQPVSGDVVQSMLEDAGFADIGTHPVGDAGVMCCVVGRKLP